VPNRRRSSRRLKGRCRPRHPSPSLSLPRHPNKTSGLPSLPTTRDTPGVHRPLLPKVIELRQHAARGGGRVDPPHSLTHRSVSCCDTARCDTNILMRHKSDSFCDKQAAANVSALCCVAADMRRKCLNLCDKFAAADTARARKAPRDCHSSDSF